MGSHQTNIKLEGTDENYFPNSKMINCIDMEYMQIRPVMGKCIRGWRILYKQCTAESVLSLGDENTYIYL